jgi:hypothetical protein
VNVGYAPAIVNIDFHLTAIRELIKALPKAKADVAKCKLLLGESVKAIKAARPHTWLEIVRIECGLRRRASYYYLGFAEGKPVEQHRAKNRERVAKQRALRAARDETQQAQIGKLNAQVARLQTEISELQDGKALRVENAQLHATLKKIGETLGVAIGLTGHFEHNRAAIVHKLNAAKNMADEALVNSIPTSSSRKTTLDSSLFAKAMSAPPSSQVH